MGCMESYSRVVSNFRLCAIFARSRAVSSYYEMVLQSLYGTAGSEYSASGLQVLEGLKINRSGPELSGTGFKVEVGKKDYFCLDMLAILGRFRKEGDPNIDPRVLYSFGRGLSASVH